MCNFIAYPCLHLDGMVLGTKDYYAFTSDSAKHALETEITVVLGVMLCRSLPVFWRNLLPPSSG